jgi:hypothetical protein
LSSYRAHRLLQQAAQTDDPVKAERLKKRAEEYLLLADLLEELEDARARISLVAQQQQRPQDSEKSAA